MEIKKSEKKDLKSIINIWDNAVAYQKFKSPEAVWYQFPDAILNEIKKGLHYKVVDDDNCIMMFFSLVKSDPEIWGEKEVGKSIYLHRTVCNIDFKGMKFMNLILQWSLAKARVMKQESVRMDTWAANEKLVNYYISCGFNLIGYKKLGSNPKLLKHYRNTRVALFENKV
jgi:hypothetical protein